MSAPSPERPIRSPRLALLAALLVAGCAAEEERPPNLLFVTIDTLRMDHTGLDGYARDTTPFLDRWSEGGVVFERAYSASSWTLPSMSMLLTGQVQVKNEGRIFPKQAPLAELLRQRGYRTGAVIANPLLTSERGFDRGFDHFEIKAEHRPGSLDWLAPDVTERGIEFLSKGREPFFLLLHYFDPHDPYVPIEGLAFPPFSDPARREAFRDALPEDQRDRLTPAVYRGIEERIAQYDSEVLQTDRGLESLLEWLEAEGLADDTVVVVTADHGEGLWQRALTPGEKPKEVFFPELYFEHGIQLYDEQVRVPLVFRGPGVPAGVRYDRAVSLLDVVPTLLSLLDLPRAPLTPGVALLPELPEERGLPVYSICSRGRTVTVDGRWRLHQPRDYKLEHGVRPELFDLVADPLELEPLDDPEREAELRALIGAWVDGNASVDWGDAGPIDLDKLREELAGVGYVMEEMMGEDLPVAEGADGGD